jgi:AraC-like DNA-binding protein
MSPPPDHRSEVFATPWRGVYGTCIDSARHYGRHWHATHGVGVVERGAQRSASGRGMVEAQAGDLITTNPGEVHDGRPVGGASRRWRMVYFEPGVMAAMAGDASAAIDVEITQPVIRDAALSQALRQLFARLDAWGAESSMRGIDALACEESLVDVCALLVDHHSTSAPLHEAAADVKRVRDRLADELLEPPSLDELATMVGLSKYQVLRRFEKTYGVPPHAWLLQQRAERARALIRHGESLVDAASASGFADQSHMTRVFTRQFGFTPGAWQRTGLR